MKKIALTAVLLLVSAWLVVELSPDPIFSPHPQAAMTYDFSLESTGMAQQGLEVSSKESGEALLTPLTETSWLVLIKDPKAFLSVNRVEQAAILAALEAEWKTPFIVHLSKNTLSPTEIRFAPNTLSADLNRILVNRRKNITRLLFLPKHQAQAFEEDCYYGACQFRYEQTPEKTLRLKLSSRNQQGLESLYEIEADDKGAERIVLRENFELKDILPLGLSTRGLAKRKAMRELGIASIDPATFSVRETISLTAASPEELKVQAVQETKDLDPRVFFLDEKKQQRALSELGSFHQTLKKLLLARPEAVVVLIKELKQTNPSDPIYVSSIAALVAVDTEHTQQGLRELLTHQLNKKAILEARSLTLGLGQSTRPSEETVDFLLEHAYAPEITAKLRESSMMAIGSIARVASDPLIVRKLLEKPLEDLEDYARGRPTRAPILDTLELIGNSGAAEAFETLRILFESQKDPQLQVAIINALRYLPQKEAAKLIEQKLSSPDQLVREQAKLALELRCQEYPERCK